MADIRTRAPEETYLTKNNIAVPKNEVPRRLAIVQAAADSLDDSIAANAPFPPNTVIGPTLSASICPSTQAATEGYCTLIFVNCAGGGTYKLACDGQVTTAITHAEPNALAENLALIAALEALSTVPDGSIANIGAVTPSALPSDQVGQYIVIRFDTSGVGGAPAPVITVAENNLKAVAGSDLALET